VEAAVKQRVADNVDVIYDISRHKVVS